MNILLSILGLATTAAAQAEVWDNLKPFEVTRFTTFTPSGRPGTPPWAELYITISDVNSFIIGHSTSPLIPVSMGPSSANCTLRFDASFGAPSPYNQTYHCSETAGKWTWELLESVGGTNPGRVSTNVDVRFTYQQKHSILAGRSDNRMISQTRVGVAHFQVGQNMKGSCGGSSACSWGLDPEKRPVLVQAEITVRTNGTRQGWGPDPE